MLGIRKINLSIGALVFLGVVSCEKNDFISSDDSIYGSIDKSEVGIQLNLENTFQQIDHFGASGGFQDQWVGKWPDASRNKVAELLFSNENDTQGNPKGIGLSMWRTVIGDGAADQASSGFQSNSWFRETECYLAPDGTYDWTKQAGEQWFMAKAREHGVSKFTAWATTPPYFMTKNGYTFSTSSVGSFNCKPDKYNAYADFLATVAKHYQDEGYNLQAVCPFNETQYEWNAEVGSASQSGTRASNTEVAVVTRKINNAFVQKGVNAKIMIPESAQLKYLFEGTGNTSNQINEFYKEGSSNYIGDLANISKNVAGHSYFSNKTTTESLRQRKSLSSALSSSGLNYWQTEYSLLGADYQQGRDLFALKEIDYALWMSRIIHTDLVYGNATGWSFWTALNQSTYGDHSYRFNLVLYVPNSNSPTHTDGTYKENKLLWALGNFSRFIRPGMQRFEVVDLDYNDDTVSVENFMISGYKDPGTKKVVLVCVNNTDRERSLTIKNDQEDFEVVGGVFEAYITSEALDLKKSTLAFDQIKIPSKAIVTLTATLK